MCSNINEQTIKSNVQNVESVSSDDEMPPLIPMNDMGIPYKLHYQKDDVDYGDYLEKFMLDESSFKEYIVSYSDDSITHLHLHLTDTTISSIVTYAEDNKVHETLRNNQTCDNTYNSIYEWVNKVNGVDTNIQSVFDTVTIGKNNVPLCKILIDAKEDSDLESEYIEEDTIETNSLDYRIEKNSTNCIVYFILGVLILEALSFIYIIFLM